MANREDLCEWVIQALRENGGRAHIVPICKFIWKNHENELRQSGDLFYTWQYDVRWAGQILRNKGILMPANNNRTAPWQLKK